MISTSTITDRDEALRYLYGRIDYERTLTIPYHQQRLKLDRMRRLLDRLDNPHLDRPVVHIAGTKGKGSTAAMIAAILSAAGYTIGSFTSPHLQRLEERFAIDAMPCGEDDFVALVDRLRPEVEAIDRQTDGDGPTYFEITTAMAMLYFSQRGVDAALMEVGLGGRLDATNVCQPVLSVITSISFDHEKQLGSTLASIAREKAGIIKPGVPVVSGVREDEPRAEIARVCREHGSRLIQRGVDFDSRYLAPKEVESSAATGRVTFSLIGRDDAEYDLGLLGRHQGANAAVALATIQQLRTQEWRIPDEAIRQGLATVRCPARVEVLTRRPTVIVDAAHNVASVEALWNVLAESFSARRRGMVFASTQDKNLAGMLKVLLPHFDRVIFTQYTNNPRAVPAEELAALAERLQVELPRCATWSVCDDVATACDDLCGWAGPDDLICATGSFFTAAEVRAHLISS